VRFALEGVRLKRTLMRASNGMEKRGVSVKPVATGEAGQVPKEKKA